MKLWMYTAIKLLRDVGQWRSDDAKTEGVRLGLLREGEVHACLLIKLPPWIYTCWSSSS